MSFVGFYGQRPISDNRRQALANRRKPSKKRHQDKVVCKVVDLNRLISR